MEESRAEGEAEDRHWIATNVDEEGVDWAGRGEEDGEGRDEPVKEEAAGWWAGLGGGGGSGRGCMVAIIFGRSELELGEERHWC